MLIIKSLFARCASILLACFSIGLTQVYSEPTNNALQAYRDEIQQSETNASQAILNTLKDASPDNTSQQNSSAPKKPSATTPRPRSNADKAFSLPANKSANTTNSTNKNPWLRPNPWTNPPPTIWEKNAKVNPYANAPIPGPTPSPNASANAAIPSPPNIFAPPSRQSPNTNTQSNANS